MRECANGHDPVGWYGGPHCWICGAVGQMFAELMKAGRGSGVGRFGGDAAVLCASRREMP